MTAGTDQYARSHSNVPYIIEAEYPGQVSLRRGLLGVATFDPAEAYILARDLQVAAQQAEYLAAQVKSPAVLTLEQTIGGLTTGTPSAYRTGLEDALRLVRAAERKAAEQ